MIPPVDKSDFIDHLGWMILGAPKFKSRVVPDGNINVAFKSLDGGIDNLHKLVGDRGCRDLREMAAESRKLFEADEILAGSQKLVDMQKYLRRRGWKDAPATD